MNYSVEDLVKLIGIKEIEILSLREQVAALRNELNLRKNNIPPDPPSKGGGGKK